MTEPTPETAELTEEMEVEILRFSHGMLQACRTVAKFKGLNTAAMATGVGHMMAHLMAEHIGRDQWQAVVNTLLEDADDLATRIEAEADTPPELRNCAGSA